MNVFEVGSYVWYVPAERAAVYHLLVCEEIVKNTISGKDVEYVFQNTIGKRSKTISSKTCKGDFFNDREEVFRYLLEQASGAINLMLDKQEKVPKNETVNKKLDNESFVEEAADESDDGTIIELPDGTKARLKGGLPK
jgi:hypothetical protein